MSFLIVMVLLLVVMYVLMIRPQRQRQREQQTMVEAAGVGDDILTSGGIYGTIAEADGDDLVVDLGNGVTVHMTRRGIAAVLPPEEEDVEDVLEAVPAGVADDEDVVDVEAEVVEGTVDEAPVTEGQGAVTTAPDAEPTPADRR